MDITPESVLKKYWGFDHFRPVQKEVILSVLGKRDTLAIMPTGGGKSVCFQIPAIITEGICLVVTPLIALMKDQVEGLVKRGITAESIHSGLNFREVKQAFENASNGKLKFLYVSPERLETSLFKEYLPYLNVNLIAVDEAHCISQWGYDFRPSYLRIAAAREAVPDVPIIALTASATPRVQKDICDQLNFREGHRLYKRSYERANLSFSVLHPAAKENKIIDILNKVNGSSIIYCRSRKRSKDLSQLLRQNGIKSEFYHAGLNADERNRKQDEWIHNKVRAICSTNAFGMGIDKPDVRTVIHFDMPDALENYYQEAGRAGRDGKKSYAVLLFNEHNIGDAKEKVLLKFPSNEVIRNFYGALCNYLQLPAGKGHGELFNFQVGPFAKQYKFNPLTIISCLKILEQEAVISLNDGFFTLSTVEFFTSKESLEDIEKNYPQFSPVIKGLLRSYEGIFDQRCFIDEYNLARFIRMRKKEVISILNELNRLRILEYHPRTSDPKIYFINDRVRVDELYINRENIAKRRTAYEERLNAMINYATQRDVCRSVFINQYFGGDPIPPCGVCDICLEKKKKPVNHRDVELIVNILRENDAVYLKQLSESAGISKSKVNEAIRFLVREQKIVIGDDGGIHYKP